MASRSNLVKCEIANAIVMQLWVKCLISTEERDEIIAKNRQSFLSD